MTDNFKTIADYIDKIIMDDDMFIHISIIIRHKDVSWMPNNKDNNARTIYSLNIHSSQELLDNERLLKTIADASKGRVYINLTPKSYKQTASFALEHATHAFVSEQYRGLGKSYSHALWKSSIKNYNLYLVDLDAPELHLVDEVMKYINNQIQPLGVPKIKLVLNSKSGMHLLCSKFDVKAFNKKFPTIDVKKNSPTILYVS